MENPASSLERLFKPRSIALVGASDRSIWSLTAFDNLRRFAFPGRIIPVNPNGGTIHGLPAVTSLREVGEPVDAALLMVRESALLDTVDDLAAAGVGGAVILSAGFAETGAEGAARQAELTAKAKAAGVRLIGPNCLGFANFVDETPIWTTPLRRATPNPTIALVSQSGAIANTLQQFCYQQRISLTHMVSTGNEADVDVADVIDYFAVHSPARAIAVFLETVRDPEHFARAAAAAEAAGKTIVVLKVGASEAAAKAAQSHTGSLVGDDKVFDAVCRRLGMIRARSLEELVITADLAGRLGRVKTPGLALVAPSGGLCELAIDQAEAEGLNIAPLQPETLAALAEKLPAYATANNPLDVTGAIMMQPELISDCMEAMSKDPAVGLVAYVFDSPLKDDPRGSARTLIKAVGDGIKASATPGLMFSNALATVNGDARGVVEEFGIPYSGGGLRHALSAIAGLFRWSSRREPVASKPVAPATGERPLGERPVLDHLAKHGVAVVPAVVAHSASAAVEAAERFDGPVALKIASPDIQHKTEVGGVLLNRSGDPAVREGYHAIHASVTAARPDARIEGVIVSPMRREGVELLVGVTRDAQWGPAIAVGLGGIFVEAFKDTSLRLLPIGEADALEMLDELRGKTLLDGFRGAPPVDRVALAKTIVAIGEAALALGPALASLEVNPLLAFKDRIEALDGLTVWEDTSHEHP